MSSNEKSNDLLSFKNEDGYDRFMTKQDWVVILSCSFLIFMIAVICIYLVFMAGLLDDEEPADENFRQISSTQRSTSV